MQPTHTPTNPEAGPKLVLEAAILEHGLTWASLPAPTKLALSKSSSTAIKLWEGDMAWHLPLASLWLYTTPGVNYLDPQEPPASDFTVRWSLDWIDHEGRKGGIALSKEAWDKYLADPVPTYSATLAPYNMVVTTNNNPISMAPVSGNTDSLSLCNMARQGNCLSVNRQSERVKNLR